jgi:hypothetical protein
LLAFHLQAIAQILLIFSDTVLLKVTNKNGTLIASTQVMLYTRTTPQANIKQNCSTILQIAT